MCPGAVLWGPYHAVVLLGNNNCIWATVYLPALIVHVAPTPGYSDLIAVVIFTNLHNML